MSLLRALAGLCVVAPLCFQACSGATGGGSSLNAGGSSGGGSGGASASGGTGNASSGGTGNVSSGGAGGDLLVDSGAGSGGTGADDAGATDGPGVVNDAQPDVVTGCLDAGTGYQPGPYARQCAAPTSDECNGGANIDPAFPNGDTGNGYDDDCDGKVDEGCECPPDIAAGETKACWLISGTQADPGGSAVGWCASNSRGTVACRVEGTGEFTTRVWDGECRGAQPPFASDVCANGDFDCDGTVGNSKTDDCACQDVTVECPTAPLVTAPFPNPAALPTINGNSWITQSGGAQTTNWKWTATGGDCDNILPHPSFQIFNNQNATGQALGGTQANGLGPNGNQTGLVAGPGGAVDGTLFLGFALSGDYLVKGEFDLSGKHYECTVKVQVRAPGIRAEACWTPMPNDVDLHVARLQGGSAPHGWFTTAGNSPGDDCYYNSKCAKGGGGQNWGYTVSPNTACQGWGSRRGTAACQNPRLDSDNIQCAKNILDPNNTGGLLGIGFCAAENINLDQPKDGERFAVATHAYSITGTVKPHVNIYCNGVRRLSLGHDPTSGQDYPQLRVSGADTGGDFWEAAIVRAIADGSGNLTDCAIEPVPSDNFKVNKDGSPNYCVDTDPQNGGGATASDWLFMPGGGYPQNAADLCWH